ncbi:hypothetical protein PybrP1_013208 [[Pythium] brassicae (nom. inval.)]|nr:hypothetical protein PybrP1_013208 [[Pythium] brassicae (nom. inval.)]
MRSGLPPSKSTNWSEGSEADGRELALNTRLPTSKPTHWSESVVLDMDAIEIEDNNKSIDPAALQSAPCDDTLSQLNKPVRATSNAAPVRASGAAGDAGNDYRMMAKQAKTLSKSNRLGAGSKSAFQAKMSDIGALGIGLQLYFMLTKYLGVAFLFMGVLALPAIVLNNVGNGITSKMADPLQLAYTSLGNEGVNEAIAADPRMCLPVGTIDCNWTTVDTPFTTEPVTVSWIITISDCAYSIFFLFFYLYYRVKATQAIEAHMNENLTPAKYAVYVRGLPTDATEAEIMRHFNALYNLSNAEEYFPLWFGCCWGRRRRVKHSQSKNAVNRSVVTNLDHLADTTSVTKALYLNTWVAEVSIGHPTGGLLRTFLSMEALTQSIAKARGLHDTLREEKTQSPSAFRSRDEKLLEATVKRLDTLCEQLEKKKSKIKELQHAAPATRAAKAGGGADAARAALKHQAPMNKQQLARATVTAAAKAAKVAATNTERAFDWDACDCAFVVFNNVESRRRCLQDYRLSTARLAHRFQPALLRFRDGQFPLVVRPAPEPSDILWENLEVTGRGRFYRRSLTNFVTFLLLLVSAVIISAAQSAHQQFEDKAPPSGLCETKLPQVFYGSSAYTEKKTRWKLVWDETVSCPPGAQHEVRYHIAYENGVVNAFNFSRPVVNATAAPQRCVEPCISEASDDACNTLPCFDQALQDSGEVCETYVASHVLYCYCSTALVTSIKDLGYIEGPKTLWRQYVPCRGYIKDFAKKNGFIVMAAGVVIVVNMLMDVILRAFADFERHYSESSKASGIALKLFAAQFLNTAIVVLVVNASLGLTRIPVVNELLKGKYKDFERDWYPTVGMGITTTMLINAFLPQLQLFVHMFIVSPLRRELKRRRIRTQDQMNKLYAGPVFDISMRYPMILNSVFVTMVFCGGSPVLLFIASLAAAGTYWFDKLSIVYLYSVKTAYSEELGEIALGLLPWSLVLHLGFSTWMYGNAKLMKATLLNMKWMLRAFNMDQILRDNRGASNDVLYQKLVEKASTYDVLGKYGFIVKVLRSNVMLIFLFFAGTVLVILLSAIWLQVLWPILRKVWVFIYRSCCLSLFGRRSAPESAERDGGSSPKRRRSPVVIPEYTDYFRKSVQGAFQPDKLLGYERDDDGLLIRKWRDNTRFHGVKRVAGERMRTWETMQAATRSYAIETNEKYQLAVAEVSAASKALRVASVKPASMADGGKAREVKVVLLGDTGVGKSSLVLRFVTNNFRPYSESTIGASFMSKMIVVNDTPIKYQIWDTAGQEKYHSLAPMYYRGAAAAIVVYDITRKQSLATLKNWVKELKQLGPDNIVIAIAGNKSDLEEKREVPASQARAYAEEIGALFIETSAKEDRNVSDLFIQISQALPTASSESNALPEIVDPYGSGKKKSGGCC